MKQSNKNAILILHNKLYANATVMVNHLRSSASADKEAFIQLKSIIENVNNSFEELRDCIELVEYNGWRIPADWRCPSCKTPTIKNVSDGGTITCVQGHLSQ